MKKIENYNVDALNFNELLLVNGGTLPEEGSYDLGHLIGSTIRTAATLAFIGFGMFN
jgi:hypothetical protein